MFSRVKPTFPDAETYVSRKENVRLRTAKRKRLLSVRKYSL